MNDTNSRVGDRRSLYTTRAHVFQINPITRDSWIPKGSIPVSFIATLANNGPSNSPCDPYSGTKLKIVCTADNGEPVVESFITPKTVFTKRIPKFGQWTDPTGMIYGLGFDSEVELNEFMKTFLQLQQEIFTTNGFETSNADTSWNGQSSTPQQANRLDTSPDEVDERRINNGAVNGEMERIGSNQYPNNSHNVDNRRLQQLARPNIVERDGSTDEFDDSRRSRSQSGPSFKPDAKPARSNSEIENSPVSHGDLTQNRDQMKYENERLKQALEESAKNAKIWNTELQNLRTNNVKLTQALQESRKHVDEWTAQLENLTEENKELRMKVIALESSGDPEKRQMFEDELEKYKCRAEQFQEELKNKDEEVESIRKAMQLMKTSASDSNENIINHGGALTNEQKQRLNSLEAKFGTRISELNSVRKEFAQLVEELNQ